MQTQFNIHEAKTHLSRLIEQVETGGEVIITRAGQPVVRLNGLMASFDGRGNIADQLAMPAGDEIDVDGPNFRDPPQVDQDLDGNSANRSSDRTRLAIEELEAGRGKTFADVDDLMRDLQKDD